VDFLVRIEIDLPPDLDPDRRAGLVEAEATRGRELRDVGSIVRMWRVPGRSANVGIWSAANPTDLNALLAALPLFDWTSITVEPLATHYLEDPDA
jgi:muconolactone D-isomerase